MFKTFFKHRNMKFTKEDAYKELVAKMTAKGEKLNLSQRSINEQIEALLPLVANDEMELVDFVEKVLPLVRTADANVRNDVSQGIKDYKDSNPAPTNPTNTKPITLSDDAQAELLKRIDALEQRNKAQELELRVKGIKAQLTSKMKELGIKNDKWMESLIANVNITEDFDVDAKAQGYLELYNSMQSDIDVNVTPEGADGRKPDYIGNSIKEAAELAKSQTLVG